MKKYFATFISIAIVMIVLDLIWLGMVAQPLYQHSIGHLMAAQPNLGFAALFYIVYIFGLMMFTLMPYATKPGLSKTVPRAAFFGFFVYASYDLTNLALLKDWPFTLAAVGIAWGILLSGISAAVGKLVLDRYTKTRYFKTQYF
ncbi:MAG: DUF2177 family protein [Pseudomonadota bacterium]